MFLTPYEILGVSPSATDDEIKQAYKEKAVHFSGNYYSDNKALDDVAKAKMAELDSAYDEIILSRSGNVSSSAEYSSQANQDYFRASGATELGDIRAKINEGRLDDAETLLDGISKQKRTAEWYYLKGVVQHKRGWFDEASKNYNTAHAMDPSNQEYKQARDKCEYNRNGKFDDNVNNSGCCSCSPCSICSTLMLADCCCSMCGCGR